MLTLWKRAGQILIVLSLLNLSDAHSQSKNTTSVSKTDTIVWFLNTGKKEEARAVAQRWLSHSDKLFRAEAHKGFANILLQDASVLTIEKNDVGGLIRDGIRPEVYDSAIVHLDKAIVLSPADLSIYKGRLYLELEVGRYNNLDSLMEHFFVTLSSSTEIDEWLPYCQEFFDRRQFEAGVDFARVLEKHYPKDHRIVANIGAFLAVLERDDEAIAYARRAVELKPDDPINNWNLGRLLMYTEKLEEADRYYKRSLELQPAGEEANYWHCMYADFVEQKLGDIERACKLRKGRCKVDIEKCRD